MPFQTSARERIPSALSVPGPGRSRRFHGRLIGLVIAAACLLQPGCSGDNPAEPLVPTLTKTAGDDQDAAVGTAVAIAPSVTVRDQNGNAMANVVVTFSVGQGGGTMTLPQATTSSTGVATIGSWTLGALGANTLNASAPGATPVTFAADAIDPCDFEPVHAFGTTTNGQLSTLDCLIAGFRVDAYTVTLPATGAFRFTQTAAFDTELLLFGPDLFPVALNDDADSETRNSAIKALVAPGTYHLVASSYDEGVTGAYMLSSGGVSSNVINCEEVFIGRGVSSVQTLQASDCESLAGFYDDTYAIFLRAGQPVTISMTSTAFDAFLELLGPDGSVANNNRDGTTTDAQIVLTPTSDAFYYLFASSNLEHQVGAYTLTISAAAGGSGSSAGLRAAPGRAPSLQLARQASRRLRPSGK